MRHFLPGEGEPSDWFDRLNAFEQAETQRQVAFKRTHWLGLTDGGWSKKPDYTYPHILPEGEIEKAFFPPIARPAIEYCDQSNIAIHSEALNLRSSQVCCFNVIFPMRMDLELAAVALAPVLPGVRKVTAIEFEYTGPEGDGATQWLGEPPGGKRGQNRTSIDVAAWWEDGQQRFLTLIEWKYTERSYGTCGGYDSERNRQKDRCRNLDISLPGAASQCYLTQGRHTRRYWEHLAEAGIKLSLLAGAKSCPFMGPFYQLLRQHLLAAYLRKVELVDEVRVASASFRGNTSLRQDTQGAETSVEDAWNKCLVGVPAMLHVDVEEIISAIRVSPRKVDSAWLDYLNQRYGL